MPSGSNVSVGTARSSTPRELYRRTIVSVAAFAGIAVLTWLRAALAGTIVVDAAPLSLPARFALLAVFAQLAAIVGWQYLRVIDEVGCADLPRLVRGAVAIHVAAACALPFTSNDLFSSLAYGRMVLRGLNPYEQGPAALGTHDAFAALVGSRWTTAPTDHGPLSTGLAALAASSGSVVSAMVLYKLALLACALGAIGLAWRACRFGDDADARAFALLAFNPLLAWEVSGQAHNDGLLVLGAMAFLVLVRADRVAWATCAMAAALQAKLAIAPQFGLFVVAQWRASPLRAIAIVVGTALFGAACFAPFWFGPATLGSIASMSAGGPAWTSRSFADLAVHTAGFFSESARHHAYDLFAGAATVVLSLAALRAASRVRTTTEAIDDALRYFLLFDLVGPWFQPWYATWLLPCAWATRDRGLARLVAIYTTLLLVQYGIPIDPVSNVAIDIVVIVLWRRSERRAAVSVA
ncbi:MAG: polyprenol phosphomannose-dependent alpha 1,6 mannosyltransferase MptB [Polyangiales bacterium]